MLNTNHHKVLLHILAGSEILWSPWRANATPRQAQSAIEERRANFATAGVPVICSGTDAERKQVTRSIDHLQEIGYVKIFRGKAKRLGARLTPAGDAFARALAPVNTLHQAWPTLRKLAKVAEQFAENNYVCELDIDRRSSYRTEAGRMRLADLENDFQPLLVNQLVESTSDTQGRLGYCVIDAGVVALKGKRPPKPPELPYDQALGDWYFEQERIGLVEREKWKPSRPNCCWVPLGAGGWHPRSRVYR